MKAKEFCIITLVLAIALLIVPISESKAEEEPEVKTSRDYEYIVLKDETACIIRYNGEDAKVIVPEEIDRIRVTGIGDKAFFWGKNLKKITIPVSVKKIAYNPFIGCENLLNINISADHPTFAFIDNILIYKPEKKIVIYLSTSKESKYKIPDEIESIGDRAFSDCKNLTEITIPDSVQSIRYSAFSGCDNLKKINIPASVDTIGEYAFEDCDNITVTVEKGSFAEKYCKENNTKYMYEDSLKN